MIAQRHVSEAITIPRRLGISVRRAIQFNTEDIPPRPFRVSDSNVDEQPGEPDVSMYLVSLQLNHMFNLITQGTQRGVFRRKASQLQASSPGIVKEEFEGDDTFAFRPVRIDIFVGD
ncbi:MAG TPA: hypothetical protein VN682_22645 [Terriglobales bacterium]|nr:hypothetical protein [Terriglobales bacterium]